jgi:2-methylisocitrate lyase-like PEP mutase family enzyme
MKILNKEIKAPTLANMVEGGRTPLFTNAKLQDLGYGLVIWPTASTYVTAFMMQKLMKELMEKDTTEGMMNEMIEFGDFNKLIGLEEYNNLGLKFIR